MYARLITVDVQPDKMESFPQAFNERLLPEISREAGFKGLYLMRVPAQSQVRALVLWESEADALASIEGLRARTPRMADLLVKPPAAETLEVILRA
jgi:heme-degrading monooxygenase HmoA